MSDATKPGGRSRARSIALPWIGRSRRRGRADGLPVSPKPTARRILTIVAGGAVAIGCVIAAIWLAILYMPLPASQVIPRVKAAIQERLGADYTVDIADAEIQRGDGVELRLVDLQIAKANGGPVVARVPRAELRLNGLGLLGGDVQVRSVHVTSPRLDMTFDTAVDAASKKSDLPARILSAVQDLDRLLGADGAAGALEQVEVTGATVRVAPSSRQPLSFDDVDLRLSRGGGGAIALTASSAKPDDRWTTAITVSASGADKARVIDLGIENLNLAPYSAPFAEKAGAPPVTGRVSGHLNAKIAADGTLLAGDGRMEARALDLSMPGSPPAGATPGSRQISVDRVQFDLRWDAPSHALRIVQSQFRSRGGQFNFSGALVAPSEVGKPWIANLAGTDVLLSGETPGDPPLRLDRIDIDASFDPTAGVLEVSKAQIIGPTARAAISGLVRFEGASPAIRVGLVTSPMPASAVKRLWPFFLAKAARGWVVENVGAGTVDRVSLTIDLPAGALAQIKEHDPFPEGSVALEVLFRDGVLRGKVGMPWVEGAVGRVEATSRNVVTTIDSGYVSGASEDGPLAVSNVRFEIPDLAPHFPAAEVSLRADGSLRRALTLLQSGSFGANPVPAQLDVSKVSGHVASDIKVGLELNHTTGDAPTPIVNATADMKDVKIGGVFAGRSFDKGSFQLRVGDGLANLTGKGVVGTAPATVSVSDEPGAANGTFRRKLQATLTADAGDLTKLGLDVPGTLKGAVPLTAELPLDQPGAPMTVKADLAGVGIDGLVPGFSKPAGRPGKLGFIVDKTPDGTVIRDFALDSGDRSVRGTIEFGPKGELVAATLPIYRPGPGDDAKIEIDKGRGGVTKIAVQGASLDLKPLVDKVRGKSGGRAQAASAKADSSIPKNLDITAKLGTGLGYGGEAIAGLDLKLTVRDGKVTDADGTGRIGEGAIKLTTGEGGRINLIGGDAGSFFRFADLYGRIGGGGFLLNASLADGPGELKMRDFEIRNETALERARRATNADKGAQQADRATGATRFSRLKVSFVRQSGAIEVKDAVVYGPTLGAQLSGTVNYTGDKVDLVGTFVPIYALNNLFGRLPVIGEILGGGQNGGLLGVTFSVRGPTSAPTVTVNPLSLVAPGFFRKIFEFRQNGTAATGAEPPPPQSVGPQTPATQQ